VNGSKENLCAGAGGLPVLQHRKKRSKRLPGRPVEAILCSEGPTTKPKKINRGENGSPQGGVIRRGDYS